MSHLRSCCFLLGVVVASAAPAHASVAPPSAGSATGLTDSVRRRVSDEIRSVLQERCPDSCDLGIVNVEVERRAPPPGATPGFDELNPQANDFVVKRVEAELVFDRQLTTEFRTGLRTLLSKRFAGEGIPIVYREAVLKFPVAPKEPPQMPPWMPSPPAARAEPPPPAPSPPPTLAPSATPPGPWAHALDALPALFGLVLCGGIVWMVLRHDRRIIGELMQAAQKSAASRAPEPVETTAAAAKSEHQLARAAATLRQTLEADQLSRELMRDFVTAAPPADVAIAVELLGPTSLDAVRNDPACRRPLELLADHLRHHPPARSSADTQRIVEELERRILLVHIERAAETPEAEFAFLRSVDANLFHSLIAEEPAEQQVLILRHAPQRLVELYTAGLSLPERERLLRRLLAPARVSRATLGEVARAFRQKLSQLVQLDEKGSGQLLAAAILQRASAEERVRILAGLRDEPETLRAALGSFVGKETLAALDLDLIASVMSQLDFRTTALFLSTLDEAMRGRVLAALPKVTATALLDELDSAASPLEREGATRVVLAAIRRLVDERGIDLAAANWQIFLGGKAGAAS